MKFSSFTLLLSFLYSIGSQAAVTITHEPGKDVYQISLSNVAQKEIKRYGNEYVAVSVDIEKEYEGVLYKENYPELPAIRFLVRGEGKIHIEADSRFEIIPLTSSLPLLPSFVSIEKIPGNSLPNPPSNYLPVDGSYPGIRYEIKPMGSQNGVPLNIVSVYPIDVDGTHNELHFFKNFRVTHYRELANAEVSNQESIAYLVGKPFLNSPSLNKYLEFKKQLGYNNFVIPVNALTDGPNEIRTKIKKLYAQHRDTLKFVMVIGDQEHVSGYFSPRVHGVTDHYYRAIDTDDYENDIGSPEVSLGRLSVASEEDLKNIVEKNIKYTVGKFEDESWLGKSSLMATDDPSWFGVAEESMNYLSKTYTQGLGYFGNFPTLNLLGGDKLYAISHKALGSDVMKMVSEGRGFVTYGGHGGTGGWSGPEVTNEDVMKLTATSAIPVITSHACYTGNFVGDSFAEAWTRHKYGAVMMWASMDVDFWGEGDYLQRLIYDTQFKNHAKNFGELNDKAVQAFWIQYQGEGKSKYFWESYVTFGDPTVSFRTAKTIQPRLFRVSDGTDPESFQVTDEKGRSLTSARVVLISKSGVARVAYSNSNGIVEVSKADFGKEGVNAFVSGSNTRLTSFRLQ